MSPTSWLEIDLSRLDSNLAWWRNALAPSATSPAASATTSGGETRPRFCGVVKANAYGLGAPVIARRLANAGIDLLAVYSPDQAEEIAEAGVETPLLVLMPIHELPSSDGTALLTKLAHAGKLHLSVDDAAQLAALDTVGRTFSQPLPIHLHLDTGMSRAGFDADSLTAALNQLKQLPGGVRLAGIYSHFATADDDASNTRQMALFDAAIERNRALIPADTILHTANTCAALRTRRHHRDMVRVGLGLYGYSPCRFPDDVRIADAAGLKPIVRWVSRVIHVKRCCKGTEVGYNASRRLERDSVLGIVPAGYADGYPLALSNKSVVALPELPGAARAVAPVLGRINMDQIILDLTDRPEAGIGATVELISNDPTSPAALPRLAELSGSSPYEMLCRLSPRLPRRYVGDEVPTTFFRPRRTNQARRIGKHGTIVRIG